MPSGRSPGVGINRNLCCLAFCSLHPCELHARHDSSPEAASHYAHRACRRQSSWILCCDRQSRPAEFALVIDTECRLPTVTLFSQTPQSLRPRRRPQPKTQASRRCKRTRWPRRRLRVPRRRRRRSGRLCNKTRPTLRRGLRSSASRRRRWDRFLYRAECFAIQHGGASQGYAVKCFLSQRP
jgi:hypothetical protein